MTALSGIPAHLLRAAAELPENRASAEALRRAAGLSETLPIPLYSQGVEGEQRGTEARQEGTQIISLTLPLPPSVNSYWRSVPATRNRIARVLISEQGRRFKRACREAAQAQCRKPLTGDVSLRCVVYFKDRRRDLDNICKPLLDALNGVVYGDDRQIAHLELTRRIDPRRPRVEVLAARWCEV